MNYLRIEQISHYDGTKSLSHPNYAYPFPRHCEVTKPHSPLDYANPFSSHCERMRSNPANYNSWILSDYRPQNDEIPCQLPSGNRNYTIVDKNKVDFFVSQKEASLPYLADILTHSNNEVQIVETLHIINSMLDEGVKGVDKMYPVFARFNNTTSPNIQTYLAGIYRKTQVPDAFGPLVKMLIQNSLRPQTSNFDPNEEIGGAILSYVSDRFNNTTFMQKH